MCISLTLSCPSPLPAVDQAILNALELFDGLVAEGKVGPAKEGFVAAEGAAA